MKRARALGIGLLLLNHSTKSGKVQFAAQIKRLLRIVGKSLLTRSFDKFKAQNIFTNQMELWGILGGEGGVGGWGGGGGGERKQRKKQF